ncbi:MAG: CoA transferase [Syntrophomonas sp.]
MHRHVGLGDCTTAGYYKNFGPRYRRSERIVFYFRFGLSRKIEMAYNWGAIEGEDKVFRRAVEQGIPRPSEIEEYSNMGVAIRWSAASMGLDFMPTKSLLGSDIVKYNPKIKIIRTRIPDAVSKRQSS